MQGKIIYPESQKGEILVRGYEVRRTDSFDLQSQALSHVFDLVLDRDIEGGYVHSIGAGIYDYVVVLDFKSMYPFLILSTISLLYSTAPSILRSSTRSKTCDNAW